ncbi:HYDROXYPROLINE-RICH GLYCOPROTEIN FAMILY PROTEIN [Salix viminalis]|uniref:HYDROXYPROLINE-RICH GLYCOPROTEIN FAMILY PROTEIN n=1 Tax=Salix viminalis TaxID=40686 RepID=A0A9Q0NLF6_SALVM|nr:HYDROXYPROLINE-RICH GLYCOPROTEIN FAMILY PROTEIN [Salix viminalis]
MHEQDQLFTSEWLIWKCHRILEEKHVIRQQKSVPFLWAGVAKKEWKPERFLRLPKFNYSLSSLLLRHKHQEDDSSGENFGDEQGMFNSDLESFSFKTDDSFCSAPSLLASPVAIFTAVSVQETSPTDDIIC